MGTLSGLVMRWQTIQENLARSSVGGSSPAIKMGKDLSLNNLFQQEAFTQHIFWLTRNREWLMQQTMVVAPLQLFLFMETSLVKLSTESFPRTAEMQVIPTKL